jgi:hypothetical protein
MKANFLNGGCNWAVDSSGATIDFLLTAKRDAAAGKRFLAKALGGANHPHPRVINTDKDASYPPAIGQLKAEGALEENCGHRPVQYLNNVLEQDHRAIKRRVRASQHFRSFWGAWRTIAGYEAIHMIRKGQPCWSAVGAKVGLLHRFIVGMFLLQELLNHPQLLFNGFGRAFTKLPLQVYCVSLSPTMSIRE